MAKGGNLLVDSSVRIAHNLRIPTIIIGATIVSIGTTLPEVATSINAAIRGDTAFALGNAIGSINFNIGLILSIVIILSSITINRRVFLFRGGFLIFFTLVFYVMARMDNIISFWYGTILFSFLIIYIITSINEYSNGNINNTPVQSEPNGKQLKTDIIFCIIGSGLILAGADLLVDNATKIALFFGVPSYIISSTLVAFGTSLPELVTAIVAITKGYNSLSVGNILGANIMNIGLAIAISAMISPIEITEELLSFDLLITIALVFLSILFGLTRTRSKKHYGFILMSIYLFYVVHLYS